MRSPYHYVRFRYDPLDLEEGNVLLRAEGFRPELHRTPEGGLDLSFNTDWNRDHLRVKADTLEVVLTKSVATLLQRRSMPFSPRDMNLRRVVFDLFPYGRHAGLSMYTMTEPEFEVE
jgi:hypothetical protein